MTRATDIGRLRELLQQRRRDLTETAIAHQREVHALKEQERDPEYEESAQVELADYTLSHLLENQRRELMLIDAALQRMDAKVFGVCIDCGQDIVYERLEALPFALRCEEDAESREAELRATGALAMPTL
jgi:DnaK suppressor protein